MSKNDNNTNVFIVTATFGNMMRFTNIPSIQHNYSNVVTAPTKLFEHVISALRYGDLLFQELKCFCNQQLPAPA